MRGAERNAAADARRLAGFFRGAEARLWADLAESGAVPAGRGAAARAEWECVALHACLRGLVAAGGFGERTADAVDAFHAAVLGAWSGESGAEAPAARRARLLARYEEYGALARGLEASGAGRVAAAIVAAAAARAGAGEPLAGHFAALHESLAEGAAAFLGAGPGA